MRRKAMIVIAGILVFAAGEALAQKAFDFALRDLAGNLVTLSDFRGKNIVLVDFWATWCVPCVKELTHFQRLHDLYKDKGLVILAITVDGPESASLVKPFMNRYRYTFPVLLDTDSKVIALYNPRVILPYSVLIDQDGNIQYAHQGYSPGDETDFEEAIVRLLEPRGRTKARDLAFHLNEAFLNRNFGDRDYVKRMREGRETQIINQLDMTAASGDFLAGIRLDSDLDFSPWDGRVSLAKRFAEYNGKGVNLRVGDYYHSIGRGLSLSVLKTFEKEGLEYIIDTTIDGGKFSYSGKRLSLDGFGGWLTREESDKKDLVAGGTAGWSPAAGIGLKFNLVGASLEAGSSLGNKSATMESLTLDIPNYKDILKVYGEFLLIQKRKYYVDEPLRGHGIYLESGFFLKNVSLLFEFKDYKNLDFEYNRPPLLESELIPVVANQFANSARNITGIAGRFDVSPPGRSTVLYGRVSYQEDRPLSSASRAIAHVFVGAEKKFRESGWINVLAGYRTEHTTSWVFYYTHGDTFHYQGNLSYPLTGRLSLELDIEGKTFSGRHLDYYERRSYLSFHYSPRWIVTLFFDQTDDPEILFFKNKRDWWGVQLEVKIFEANALRVFYGSNKGGVKCAGGVCKFFPPFEGLRVDFIFRI